MVDLRNSSFWCGKNKAVNVGKGLFFSFFIAFLHLVQMRQTSESLITALQAEGHCVSNKRTTFSNFSRAWSGTTIQHVAAAHVLPNVAQNICLCISLVICGHNCPEESLKLANPVYMATNHIQAKPHKIYNFWLETSHACTFYGFFTALYERKDTLVEILLIFPSSHPFL